jgi:hypothetical protein
MRRFRVRVPVGPFTFDGSSTMTFERYLIITWCIGAAIAYKPEAKDKQ